MNAAVEAAQQARSLSTEAATEAEEANRMRYRFGQRTGHVESHFIKANAPDGSRALWLKHTVLAPPDRPEAAVAEVWAIAFWRRGEAVDSGGRQRALKTTIPLSEARLEDAPFRIEAAGCELWHGGARGRLEDAAGHVQWDVHYPCPTTPHKPFPLPRMYTGAFPRSKALTPVPDSRLSGTFTVDGEAWQLSDWHAAQGHNWGQSHAHAYAWMHGNAWRGEDNGDGVWLEALSGRVKTGPVTTPYLTVAALHIDGGVLRFDGPKTLLSRRIHVDHQRYRFELSIRGARLQAEIETTPDQMAGLKYHDPDGGLLHCLNSKLARGRMRLRQGKRTRTFTSDRVALEIGTRDYAHGVALRV